MLQSCVFSLDNPIKDNVNSILSNKSYYIEKIKPFNTKIKLDLTNEENSIIKYNNISLNNNKLKNNYSIKRVIYITKNNNLNPNSFIIKFLIDKNTNNNNMNNSDNQLTSAYYIYASNRINNNYMNNSGNKILY